MYQSRVFERTHIFVAELVYFRRAPQPRVIDHSKKHPKKLGKSITSSYNDLEHMLNQTKERTTERHKQKKNEKKKTSKHILSKHIIVVLALKMGPADLHRLVSTPNAPRIPGFGADTLQTPTPPELGNGRAAVWPSGSQLVN